MTNKQIIVMILAFTLVAVFCATGVFADSLSPLPVVSDNLYNTLVSEGVQINSGSWYSVYAGSLTSNTSSVYVGAVPNPDVSGYYSYYAASLSSGQGVRYNNSASSSTATTLRSNDINPDVFYTLITTSPNLPTSAAPIFSTLSDFLDFVENPTSGYVQDMTVPAGYALRLYSSDSFDLVQVVLSVPNSWNFPKDSLSSVRYNGSRLGLYSDNTIIQGASADSGSFVPWVALNANLFGRASVYSYTWEPTDYTVYPSYSYVITNPFYAGEAVQNESGGFHQNTDMIVTLYYTASDQIAFDLIPLRQSLSAQDGTFYYANAFDINAGVIHGTIIPGENDDPGYVDFGNPPIGGGNADQPPLSENTTIFGVLNTLTSTITDLFNRAGDAMRSLVQASNSFFTSVIGFFGWLPPEWSAVMWSFFMILTVLGVVKLFL